MDTAIVKKRRKNINAGIWGICLALLLGAFTFGEVFAASASIATIVPDPLSLGLKQGETGRVAIRVQDVENLYGMELHISFDPRLIEVVDTDPAKPGVQIEAGGFLPGGFVATNNADNSTGKIDYAVTLLNPATPVSGEGVLVIITFQGKMNGSSPLKIEQATLASRDGIQIPSQAVEGVVGVSASGTAPQPVNSQGQNSSASSASPVLVAFAGLAVLIFLIAVILLVVVLRRKRN